MSRTRLLDGLFWLLLLLYLTPLILFRFLPSEDGPTHIYNSLLLRDWFFGHAGWEKSWLMLNPALPPNVLGHVVAATLLTFCSPSTADRILISIYVISLAVGFRFAVRSVATNTGGLELLAFPFLLTSHLHWGFYNFCLSIAMLLWTLGLYLRIQDRLSGAKAAVVALLIVLTVLASPVGFGEILICLPGLELIYAVQRRLSIRALAKRLAVLGLVCLPAILIYVSFMLNRLPSVEDVVEWPSVKYAAAQLVMLAPLATWSIQIWLARAVVLFYLLLTVAALYGLRQSRRPVRMRFALLAAVTGAVVFLAPVSVTGGTMITPRLAYVPYFAWTLWLVENLELKQLKTAFPIAACTLAVAFAVVDMHFDRAYNQTTQNFLNRVPGIRAHATLCFETLAPGHAVLLDPAVHGPALGGGAGAYVAVRDGLMLLSNYEAHTNHFPLHFKPGRDIFLRIPAKEKNSRGFMDCADIPRLRDAGEAPDYILRWGPPEAAYNFENCGYNVVTDSQGPERLTLFRKQYLDRP